MKTVQVENGGSVAFIKLKWKTKIHKTWEVTKLARFQIELTTTLKYFGIIIIKNLTFGAHNGYINTKENPIKVIKK